MPERTTYPTEQDTGSRSGSRSRLTCLQGMNLTHTHRAAGRKGQGRGKGRAWGWLLDARTEDHCAESNRAQREAALGDGCVWWRRWWHTVRHIKPVVTQSLLHSGQDAHLEQWFKHLLAQSNYSSILNVTRTRAPKVRILRQVHRRRVGESKHGPE